MDSDNGYQDQVFKSEKSHRTSCQWCCIEFDTVGDLVKHQQLECHFNSKGNLTCPMCNHTFGSESILEKHIQNHNVPKEHQCNHAGCKKAFRRKDALIVHSRTHSGEKPYKCAFCDKTFRDNGSLTKHLNSFHQGEMPFKCDECSKGFMEERALKCHMGFHNAGYIKLGVDKLTTTGRSSQLKKSANKSTSPKHVSSQIRKARMSGGDLECGLCGKCFNSPLVFRRHVKNHDAIKSFQCTFCEKGFTRKDAMVVHMRTHTGEKPYKCNFCDRSFTESGSLLNHTNSKHKYDMPYECDLCDKRFLDERGLKTHMGFHKNA